MSTLRVGDWVRYTEAWPVHARKMRAGFERVFKDFLGRADRPESDAFYGQQYMGLWGRVIEPEKKSPWSQQEVNTVRIRWPDGTEHTHKTEWLERYEAPPERRVLADWLLERERPKLADRVLAPDVGVWCKAVSAAWWHQPDARALCEAAGHPWLWGGIWQCAVSLELGQPVDAAQVSWGLILSVPGPRGELTCPVGAETEPTAAAVSQAVAYLHAKILRATPPGAST